MNVRFSSAVLKIESEFHIRIWYAVTPYGIRALEEGKDEITVELPLCDLSDQEFILTIDLTGLDKDLLETIVDSILMSGLLAEAGIKNKGDAVLFMLTNQALHALDQIRRLEESEGS